MPDNDPSQKKTHPHQLSGWPLATLVVFFGTAVGGVLYGVNFLVENTNEQEQLHQLRKSRQLEAMNLQLKEMDADARVLKVYNQYAKEGTITKAECTVAELIVDFAAADRSITAAFINSLSQSTGESDSQLRSYRRKEQEAYSRITTLAGTLKESCQHLFTAADVVQSPPKERKAEWWQKPELSVNLNK